MLQWPSVGVYMYMCCSGLVWVCTCAAVPSVGVCIHVLQWPSVGVYMCSICYLKPGEGGEGGWSFPYSPGYPQKVPSEACPQTQGQRCWLSSG